MTRVAGLVLAGLFLVACSGSPTFGLSNAMVDDSYACPPNAHNAAYDVQATISAHNGTANSVLISSVTAVMTLSAVSGTWLQKVGDRYDAGSVAFTPSSVGAGATTTLQVTIPSSCTHGRTASGTNYGEYSVAFKVVSSAGPFSITSKNKHRILA